MQRHYNVLFLCTGNSARSIMAEAILNWRGRPNFIAYSAGSHPKGEIHPAALRQVEIGKLPTTGLRSKSWEEFARPDAPHLDFVFTVCDNAAKEICPIWPGHPMTAHWGIPDPAAVEGSQEQVDRAFREAFTILDRRIGLFLCLPLSSLDKLAIKKEIDQIEDAGLFRFDFRISDKTTAFVRGNIDDAYIDNPTDALGTHNVIPHRPTNLVMQLQHIFSPRTVNETRFGINRANYHNYTYGTSPLDVSPGPFDGLSGTSLDTEVGTTFSYIDNLTLIRGRHTFKTGIDFRRIRLNNSGNTITTSSISYDTADDFINNAAADVQYLEGEGVVGQRRTFYMGYGQDEFKASPNLTLNLGLRYEYYTVAHEILDRAAVVDIQPPPQGCNGFCPRGTPFYDPNYKNFGPRVGLAWTPSTFKGKTVIRSGFGMYYGANQNDDFSDPMESFVPRYHITSADAPNLSYPIDPFLTPEFQFYSPKAINRHRQDLYYENWDFLIQQELPHNFIGQVGYVGGSGHHLFNRQQVNLIDPATGERPQPQFAQFGLKSNYGNNNFNALQASLQRRFTAGWLFQMNYMYSHGITDSSSGAGETTSYQNQSCRACDRSASDFDIRHTMTLNSVYQLPFGPGRPYMNSGSAASKILGGWQLSGIFTANTGQPVNITLKRKASQMLDGNTSSQRPDLVPGMSIYPANQTIDNWFNPDAFAVPAKNTWGDLGRNIARGPGYYEIDTALEKRFPIKERFNLDFRASAFNLFNHPIFDIPTGNLSNSDFGRITSILNTGAVGLGAPRRIEFMLRAQF